jgi:ATPase subunit of ABC transporter with duplicated ATPase domains
MALILENLEKTFGDRVLFRSQHCAVGAGDKVGIVGPNGSSTTTLLQILTAPALSTLSPWTPNVRHVRS